MSAPLRSFSERRIHVEELPFFKALGWVEVANTVEAFQCDRYAVLVEH
jgi:hypothetical protein